MVSNSKILTVSYGTFSCTLEGFDDSFDTMKAIAEYFRDLAADDRYFGAEPPSPDAEMLARIAEREISRRVEARGTDGKIHLRADPAALPSAAEAEDESGAQSSQPAQPDAAKAERAPAAPAQPAPPETQAAPATPSTAMQGSAPKPRPAEAVSDSIADKLRRIRAVAAPSGASQMSAGYDEDEYAQDFLSDTPDFDQPAEPAQSMQADIQVSDVADEVMTDSDSDTDNARDAAAPDEAEAESATMPALDDDEYFGAFSAAEAPLADALEPQAAEVDSAESADPQSLDAEEHGTSEPEAEEALSDDAISDEALSDDAPSEDLVADTAEADSLDADEAADPVDAALDDAEDEPATDDDILSRLSAAQDDAMSDATDDSSADDMQDGVVDSADEDDLETMLRNAEIAREESDEAATYQSDDAFEDEGEDIATEDNDTLAQLLADAMGPSEDAPKSDAETQTDDEENPDTAESDAQPEEERPLAARVIKMKRTDLDAALAGGDLEEEMDAISGPSDLSPEAEAELQRELAEVEAELQTSHAPEATTAAVAPSAPMSDAPDEAADEAQQDEDATLGQDDAEPAMAEDAAEADSEQESAPRAGRLGTPASDAQAARIFEEADTQLEEPESNKRRNAIQHLRAAVAATKAERRAGGAMETDVDDKPYRSDLQSAVRPRRPQHMSTSATPRPSANPAARPAPLKLVAEQRVDTAVPPVRPRRITRADLATEASAVAQSSDFDPEMRDGSPGFAEFAEQMGANSLTDMLEAAAAYMADVEGMPQFSRPMLMQKLREAQEDEFSREDGLRSFGQLLRQGKLQKLKGGRFAVTSVTDFRQSA